MEINKPGWLETLWNVNPTIAEQAQKDFEQWQKDKTKKCNCDIPHVIGRSEQLPCCDCENFAEYDNGIKYCSVCGTKLK